MTGRVLVAPVSFGLGDLVVSLPVIQALIAEHTPVWLVARAPSQELLAERITGLAGVVAEDDAACGPDDRFVDLRDHPLQRDFWWGSPAFEAAYGALDINDILGRISADLGIDAEFASPTPLLARARPELKDTVILVHETDGPGKRWPPHFWAELAATLQADGHEVVYVTRDDKASPLGRLNIPSLTAPTPGEAVDALTACSGVIGIDTGLTHIAAQQGTPTVTVCRDSSVYFRPWPHCRVLRGGQCTDACTAAEEAYAYHGRVSLRGFRPPARECPSGSPCLAGARPEAAAVLLQDLL
jgi:Glycosyltransferase family 9 (heptosyltransferase)